MLKLNTVSKLRDKYYNIVFKSIITFGMICLFALSSRAYFAFIKSTEFHGYISHEIYQYGMEYNGNNATVLL